MPLIWERKIEDAIVALWQIDESLENLTSEIILSDEEQQKYLQLLHPQRQLEWLVIKKMLIEIMPEPVSLYYDEYGKPYILNSPKQISISHSKDKVCIILRNRAVGIDIEMIQPKINNIKHKFLVKQEIEEVEKSPQDHQLEKLYVYWCVKESLYKLHGKRNISFVEDILLDPFDYRPKGIAKAKIRVNRIEQEYELHYERINNFMMAYTL